MILSYKVSIESVSGETNIDLPADELNCAILQYLQLKYENLKAIDVEIFVDED